MFLLRSILLHATERIMNSLVATVLNLPDVIRALRGSVGGWAVRGWLSALLGLLLYRRLGEILGRMERLTARFRAGRLWRLAPRSGERAVAGDVGVVRAERIWPRQFGWLVRAASWHAAVYSGQLRLILDQPEMVALLRASPQAVRVLTPLCRMLAVETSLLRPGVEVAAVLAPVVVKRVRKPRVKVDFGRIPIPRGVLSAVRRRGFLKD